MRRTKLTGISFKLSKFQEVCLLPLQFQVSYIYIYIHTHTHTHTHTHIPVSVSDISVSGKERKRAVRYRKSNFKGSLGIHFVVGSLSCLFFGSIYHVIARLMIKSSTRRQKVVNVLTKLCTDYVYTRSLVFSHC